jgi:hypothetical protein
VDHVADPFEQLPEAHALALRLRDAGADDELIAVCLQIEPEGVGPLLRIAAAKLQRLQREGGSSENA